MTRFWQFELVYIVEVGGLAREWEELLRRFLSIDSPGRLGWSRALGFVGALILLCAFPAWYLDHAEPRKNSPSDYMLIPLVTASLMCNIVMPWLGEL